MSETVQALSANETPAQDQMTSRARGQNMPGRLPRTIRTGVCQVCQRQKTLAELIPAASIRGPVVETIRQENPQWSSDGFICLSDLNHYRTEHIEEILLAERGELSDLETEVAQSLANEELLSQNLNDEFDDEMPLGARVADRVAEFGGSWRFIILFGLFILGWIILNTIMLLKQPFDPYPFILLNLMLSCLAALQAPIIMMSQNRQEAKDRLRSEHDYKVNLKAELEIRHINEKIDHLINHQWQSMLETQQIMMEMLEEYNYRIETVPLSQQPCGEKADDEALT